MAGICNLDGAGNCSLVTSEQTRHLGWAFQMALGIGSELQARLADRCPLANAGEHILQRPALRRVIEHVVGRYERRACTFSELCEGGNSRAVVTLVAMRSGEMDGSRRERR